MTRDYRQTVTIVIDGPEALVRQLSERMCLAAANVQVNDDARGVVRWRMTQQADWLDADGNVIPLDQIVAAAKEARRK